MIQKGTIESHIQRIELLFRQYYKVLVAYGSRFVNDKAVAENLVQDVFFELWSKRDSIEFDQGIKSYLFKSVYHRALNYLNSQVVLRQSSLEQLEEEDQFTHYFASREMGQDHCLMMEELDREIQSIIDKLPAQCRNVFLLSRQEELKNREIAERLGISVKAVEKHISKALFTLREELKGKGILLLIYLFTHY